MTPAAAIEERGLNLAFDGTQTLSSVPSLVEKSSATCTIPPSQIAKDDQVRSHPFILFPCHSYGFIDESERPYDET